MFHNIMTVQGLGTVYYVQGLGTVFYIQNWPIYFSLHVVDPQFLASRLYRVWGIVFATGYTSKGPVRLPSLSNIKF